MPNLDTEFRRSEEYKQWVKAIKADHPTLPDYLVEMAIFTHLADPQGYKAFWKTKEGRAECHSWNERSKCPITKPAQPKQTIEVVGAVSVLDADDPSLDVPMVPLAAESRINVESDASASGLASDEAKN